MNQFNTAAYAARFALYNLLIVISMLFLVLVTGCGKDSDLAHKAPSQRECPVNAFCEVR
jgi:hypothetical protein